MKNYKKNFIMILLLVSLLIYKTKDIIFCKLNGFKKCCIHNVIASDNICVYKCCNRILTDLEVHKWKKFKHGLLYHMKPIKINHDRNYFISQLTTLYYKRLNNDDKTELSKYFCDVVCDTGNKIAPHIYNINNKFDGKYIMEIWCFLNNVEMFNLDWETE